MVVLMSKRDKLFQQFGPLLLETICRVIKDEINLLRQQFGLPPRTDEQIYDQIINHYGDLKPYEWMEDI